MFIVLEGIDGSGKTTIAKELIKYFQNQGINVVYTREPGGLGLEFSENIRKVIFKYPNLSPLTLTMLFLASRIEHLKQFILPNLDQGNVVICDRYYYSSIVYQGVLENLGINYVKNLNCEAITKISGKLLNPDYVFFLEISPEIAKNRKAKSSSDKNYFDEFSLEKYQIVNNAYKQVFSTMEIQKNIYFIDANLNTFEVLDNIIKIIK